MIPEAKHEPDLEILQNNKTVRIKTRDYKYMFSFFLSDAVFLVETSLKKFVCM